MGSMSQVSLIMEASTVFVSFRFVLYEHDMKDSMAYVANGIMMAISFFIFRICWFNYAIFSVCLNNFVYEWDKFKTELYPQKEKRITAIIALCVYILFYGLNLYWFSR